MLCDCLGNFIKTKEMKFVKGKKIIINKIYYCCNRCHLILTEKEYEKLNTYNKTLNPTQTQAHVPESDK
jgi:hypothetical protein